jgi:hypothetical protein
MSETGRSVTVRVPTVRVLVGVVAVVALIAGAVVAGVKTHDLASKNRRLEHGLSSFDVGALQAARSYAITFATYDYDSLDADFAKTEAHSIDPFLSQYKSETAQLRPTLVQAKASSSATVISEGLASVSSTSAVVDLFLNQTIENSKGTHVDAQRVEMTLVRRHGTWLILRVVLP